MTAFYVIFGILIFVCAALHFASAFASRLGNLFSYINIGMHILLIAIQLLLGFELSLLALVMTSSALLYLFLSYIRLKLTRGRGKR